MQNEVVLTKDAHINGVGYTFGMPEKQFIATAHSFNQ